MSLQEIVDKITVAENCSVLYDSLCAFVDISAVVHVGHPGRVSLDQQRSMSNTDTDTVDYYAALGIHKDATNTDIKKASVSVSVAIHQSASHPWA